MMTSCTQDELISSDKGKEPATAGSCLTLVGLSSPQTRVSIGDKTGDVYPVLWSEGDALGVFSRTAGTDINNVQSLLSDESIGQNSGVFTSDDVKMAEEEATELLIYYPYRASTELAENGNKITSTLSVEQEQSRPGDSHHIGKYGFAFIIYIFHLLFRDQLKILYFSALRVYIINSSSVIVSPTISVIVMNHFSIIYFQFPARSYLKVLKIKFIYPFAGSKYNPFIFYQ